MAVSPKAYVISILIMSSFSFLTILNLFYLLRRVIFLNQKSFHLMMWTLLQLCYICAITSSVLVYRICLDINGLNWKHLE